jgi:hypothetical protein
MKTDNLISVDVYLCNPQICRDCYEQALDSIRMAEALNVIAGKQYIEFTKYDRYIAGFLNELKDKAQKTGSHNDAYDYVSVSAGFFNIRHEFINHLGFEYSENNPDQISELKRLYEIAAPSYKNLADHVALAHELLFRSTPVPADLSVPEDSNKENPDSK